MTLRRLLPVVVLGVAVQGCATPTTDDTSAPPFGPPDVTVAATVVHVNDGDTFVVRTDDGDEERVRLLRIDTPEEARDGQPAECLADEATAALERLAGEGTRVLLATDVEVRDRFDRLLAHVWRADDGTWVNGEMLATGHARVVTFPPNVAWDDQVLALQDLARDSGLGLWSAC